MTRAITITLSFLFLVMTVVATNQSHQLTLVTNDTDIILTDAYGNRLVLNKTLTNQTNITDFRRDAADCDIEIDNIDCSDSIINCGNTNISLACPADTITCPDQTSVLRQCLDLINASRQPPTIVATLPPQQPTTQPFLIPTSWFIIGGIIVLLVIFKDRILPRRPKKETAWTARPDELAQPMSRQPYGGRGTWDGPEPPRFDEEARRRGLI